MAPRRKSEKNPLSPEAVLASLSPDPVVEKPKKAGKARTAKAPKAVKAKAAKAEKAAAPAVLLDYPQEGEQVLPGHYSVRVAAAPERQVEVSIDGGAWRPCREAVGYYWYDWEPSELGEHRIVARATNGSPRPKTSEERHVVVVPPSSN